MLQRLSSRQYYLLAVSPDVHHRLPVLDGWFAFVILADDPGRIYCGSMFDEHYEVDGHTSLSYRQDVLFAGGLEFKRGKLLVWDNASGLVAIQEHDPRRAAALARRQVRGLRGLGFVG